MNTRLQHFFFSLIIMLCVGSSNLYGQGTYTLQVKVSLQTIATNSKAIVFYGMPKESIMIYAKYNNTQAYPSYTIATPSPTNAVRGQTVTWPSYPMTFNFTGLREDPTGGEVEIIVEDLEMDYKYYTHTTTRRCGFLNLKKCDTYHYDRDIFSLDKDIILPIKEKHTFSSLEISDYTEHDSKGMGSGSFKVKIAHDISITPPVQTNLSHNQLCYGDRVELTGTMGVYNALADEYSIQTLKLFTWQQSFNGGYTWENIIENENTIIEQNSNDDGILSFDITDRPQSSRLYRYSCYISAQNKNGESMYKTVYSNPSDYYFLNPAAPKVDFLLDSVSCHGAADAEVVINAINDGVPPYKYGVGIIVPDSLCNKDESQSEDEAYLNTSPCIKPLENYEFADNITYQHRVPIPLDAGNYVMYVENSDAKCVTFENFSVTEPPKLSVDYQFSPVSCFGAKNGSIGIKASGGNGGYKFTYTGGVPTLAPTEGDSIFRVKDLDIGDYNIDVTDKKGCVVKTPADFKEADF